MLRLGWRRVLALALVLLFLGMTVSGASATATFVNATVNNTVAVPPEFGPEKQPGDEIRPQFWWIIGLIILDLAVHWFLEHYISPEVAAVYDAVTMFIDPEKIAEKLGIKGAELGIKVISRNKVLIGLFKDNKVVKEITYASKEVAEWVANKLGKGYISKIVEKYVVRDGGLKKGEDFDEVVKAMQGLESLGIRSVILQKIIIEKGWDVKKLERVINDIKGVPGGDRLFTKIKRGIGDGFYKGRFVLDRVNLGRVYIECFGGIRPEQILTQAKYAKSRGVRKIYVYYSRDVFSPGQHYRVMEAIRNAKSRFGVDVELVQLTSEFN
ncbi:hypothetical protein [Thermococcus gammatolerans]|uniref:hypothetical protein n=1 Tax=Thermococcus gammatolerans TaxID=187878 RepID=UPI000A9BBCBB|nr:hypothetical protein [Thermococcus gammatolerans]